MKPGFSRWILRLILTAMTAVIIAGCATPTAAPTQAPPPTAAPAATSAPVPTQAPAATTVPPTTVPPTVAAAKPPQKITFQAAYLAQGNISFVAAYVAKEKGYFTEQGLDVTIEHSTPGGGEQLQRLAAKQIQFTTHTGDSFSQANSATPNLPFVAVTVFGHEGEHALMLLKDSPIQTVADLKGKLVGFKSGQQPPWLAAMLTKVALTFNDIKLVPVGFDPRVILPDFGAGRVDAVQIFKSNEPDTMTRQGFAVKVFNPEDSGVHYLGQVYITHKDFIRDDPEMVRKFVRATMKSLTFVLDPANAKEVTDMVMKYAAKDANRDHNQLMWQTEIKALTGPGTKEVGLGYANDDEWNTMQQMLVTYGAMKAAVPLNQMWDPQFVKSIYKDGKLIGP